MNGKGRGYHAGISGYLQISIKRTLCFLHRIVQVGIDINQAPMHHWLLETLQLVAGLDSRKAGEIGRSLQMVGHVVTRDDPYSTVRSVDEKIFKNSAGSIRVRGIGLTSSDLRLFEAYRQYPNSP